MSSDCTDFSAAAAAAGEAISGVDEIAMCRGGIAIAIPPCFFDAWPHASGNSTSPDGTPTSGPVLICALPIAIFFLDHQPPPLADLKSFQTRVS